MINYYNFEMVIFCLLLLLYFAMLGFVPGYVLSSLNSATRKYRIPLGIGFGFVFPILIHIICVQTSIYPLVFIPLSIFLYFLLVAPY